MQNDKKLLISTAGSRYAAKWPASEMMWSSFCDKLKTPFRSTETLETYMALRKSDQDNLKDVGGYVGGTLKNDIRKAKNVTGRDLVALDLDSIPAGETESILKRIASLGCASAVYSTRKHAAHAPRLRVLIPTDRTLSPDEYEPIARRLASMIGIEFADPTTFDVNRLMYWPSCSADSEYVYEVNDRPFCSADGLLGLYTDWTDVSSWPQVPGSDARMQRMVARQADPETKQGLVGAFCRTYNIFAAMETFLPGTYLPTSQDERWTYSEGSTAGGAVVYDNGAFLYSHHATDPCSGQLVNSFDLVRLHKFGELDEEAKPNTPTATLPSYVEMRRLAANDSQVSTLINQERYEAAKSSFDTPLDEAADLSWMEGLTKSATGNIDKTINNIVLILQNDPLVKGKIALDEFANRGLVLGPLPWDKTEGRRLWSDVDDAQAMRYLETFYGITGKDKIADALLIVSYERRFNDVKTYLKSLEWDGKPRLDTLLHVYLGAEDNTYTRAVIRKSLCAAVARVMRPGVKYDYMPIITGPQGCGKSTFLFHLGMAWFSDSLQTFSGKDAAEMLQGVWINELGELTALSRAETNAVKQFLSKRDDIYREAYGRRTNRFPRQCVFFGTSNDFEFLKDATGNRRFWPVEARVQAPKASVWEDMPAEVDQIWAEAVAKYTLGEKLYLTGEEEKIAKEMQEAHREANAKEGMIAEFLEREIPANWDEMSISSRRMYLQGGLPYDGELVKREKVCAAEIWSECFMSDVKYMKKMDSVEINSIMNNMAGWVRNKSVRRYGQFGRQRGYERENRGDL